MAMLDVGRLPGVVALSPDRQEVPKLLRVALYVMLILGGILSLPRLGSITPLPMTALLDAWIIVFMVAAIVRGRTSHGGLLLLLGVYLLTRFVPALANSSPLEDTLQAYRWLLYLVAFVFAVGRNWGPPGPLVGVTWALVAMAFLKAAATFALLGPGERPGLLLENNFELALFSGLVIVTYKFISPAARLGIVALMGGLTLLSGSRSGAVAFLILTVFAVTQSSRANLFVRYMLLLAIPVVGLLAVQVFESRAVSGGTIDRVRFFDVFLGETSNWTALQWIFGTTPITPLSPGACARLSYYEKLLSSAGDGSCYSVILHAFNMRVVFDAGIFGLLLALFVAWYAMKSARVPLSVNLALLAVAFSNGFSVSGLNNPYVALPIVLAILLARSGFWATTPSEPSQTARAASMFDLRRVSSSGP